MSAQSFHLILIHQQVPVACHGPGFNDGMRQTGRIQVKKGQASAGRGRHEAQAGKAAALLAPFVKQDILCAALARHPGCNLAV